MSGACDPWGLAQANLLVGNEPRAAAIEVTVSGPELRVLLDCVVGIGGADLGAYVPEEYRDLPPGGAHLVRGGTSVRFRGSTPRDATIVGADGELGETAGIRSYLAFAGGVDVPEVLGSRSTYVAGGLGGLEGRALRRGDRVAALGSGDLGGAGRVWPVRVGRPPYDATSPLRVVAGPHADLLGGRVLERMLEIAWIVQPESDRRGLRLAPGEQGGIDPAPGEIVSLPMVWGAVQIPPDGRPIILLADHQTVGGYPVAAVIVRADWPRLGQLGAGSAARFTLVSVEDAQRAWREQHAELEAARAALAGTDAWELLPDAAG